jgi:hypothetical protein
MNNIRYLIVFLVTKDNCLKDSDSVGKSSATFTDLNRRKLRHSVYRFIKTSEILK